MTSSEGEVVEFVDDIDPNAGAKKGNVEVWLKEVEDAMKATLRKRMHEGMASYPLAKREEWVLQQTGQIVLAITSMYWTAEVTKALKSGKKGLEEQLDALNRQLDGLVGLVRRTDLSELNRLTLGALTVLDVHARDVVTRLSG
jgi:dynein heavy chain